MTGCSLLVPRGVALEGPVDFAAAFPSKPKHDSLCPTVAVQSVNYSTLTAKPVPLSPMEPFLTGATNSHYVEQCPVLEDLDGIPGASLGSLPDPTPPPDHPEDERSVDVTEGEQIWPGNGPDLSPVETVWTVIKLAADSQ
jgi:hypothetical protein